jgi:hypothetical protein
MKCTLIATALNARYQTNEMFVDGVRSAVELAQHPGVISSLGFACSTASDLLGLPLPTMGKISGLACDEAPAVGTGFGSQLESHQGFAVAKDVLHAADALSISTSWASPLARGPLHLISRRRTAASGRQAPAGICV